MFLFRRVFLFRRGTIYINRKNAKMTKMNFLKIVLETFKCRFRYLRAGFYVSKLSKGIKKPMKYPQHKTEL